MNYKEVIIGTHGGRWAVHTVLWRGDPRKRDHSEDLGVDAMKILKWIFKKLDGEARSGLLRLRLRTGGWLL